MSARAGSGSATVAGASSANQQGLGAPAPGIVILVPAFNEERFIASVVLQARACAEHVLVVDDGSTDRTAWLAEAAGATVIRMGANRGKASALNEGFRHARGLDPRAVVCLDGDAQHEPSEARILLEPILNDEADVVIGSRHLSTRSRIPRWRRFGQHLLTALTNRFSGVRVSDSQSGFRAFSRTALDTLRFTSDGLALESEMQFRIGVAGLRVAEVPISVRYQDGNKRNPFTHGMQVLDTMLSIVTQRRPIAYLSLPGVLLAVAGVALGLRVAAVALDSGTLMIGSAILTALLIISGLLLALSGLLLHTVKRLLDRLVEEAHATVPVGSSGAAVGHGLLRDAGSRGSGASAPPQQARDEEPPDRPAGQEPEEELEERAEVEPPTPLAPGDRRMTGAGGQAQLSDRRP